MLSWVERFLQIQLNRKQLNSQEAVSEYPAFRAEEAEEAGWEDKHEILISKF